MRPAYTAFSKYVRLSWCKLRLRDKRFGSGRGCKQQQNPSVLSWFWRQSPSLEKPRAIATTHVLPQREHHKSHIIFLGLLCLDSYFSPRAQPGRPAPCTAAHPDHSLRAEPSCSTGSVLPSDTGLLLTTAVSSSLFSILQSE